MAKKVILLTNLGSPDSPEPRDVKTYLREFLMDGKVIDIPYPLRFLLVNGIIAPLRARSSAKKYQTIWTEDGSPLIHITEQQKSLTAEHTGLPTYMCMRYANPTPESAFEAIERENPDLEELTLLPLYPHFAMSSYETGVEHVQKEYKKKYRGYSLKVVPPYYSNKNYIEALSQSIEPYLDEYDLILFSYHGIPERHLKKSDVTGKHCLKVENCCKVGSPAHDFCYRHQVIETTTLVAEKLGIPEDKFQFSFQSRLGPDPWLKPYTAKLFEELPQKGVKKLIVVTPAFVSDCLETLEEINEEGKEIFLENGGEKFTAIPCLNTYPKWIEAIDSILATAV
jgi:ferrochelatase